MISEILASFRDNVSRKVKNPFYGTFAIVFILQNWQLFYSLISFDDLTQRQTRIKIIEQYITNAGGAFGMFLYAVWCALIALTLAYILYNISGLISNFFDLRVKPWIKKIVDKGAIIDKSEYGKLERNYDLMEAKYNRERKAKQDATSEIDTLQKKLSETRRELEDLKALLSDVTTQDQYGDSHIDKIAYKIKRQVEDIKNKGYEEEFKKLIVNIRKDAGAYHYFGSFNHDNLMQYALLHGIIEMSGNYCGLTSYGTSVADKLTNISL